MEELESSNRSLKEQVHRLEERTGQLQMVGVEWQGGAGYCGSVMVLLVYAGAGGGATEGSGRAAGTAGGCSDIWYTRHSTPPDLTLPHPLRPRRRSATPSLRRWKQCQMSSPQPGMPGEPSSKRSTSNTAASAGSSLSWRRSTSSSARSQRIRSHHITPSSLKHCHVTCSFCHIVVCLCSIFSTRPGALHAPPPYCTDSYI